MNKIHDLKPISRTKLRIACGRLFYTWKRYFQWYFGDIKYAKERSNELLPYVHFEHKTPLIRNLKNLDMWMQKNKIQNLKIAVERLNGIMIYPGETFSYWRLIGKPSKRKGYVEGMVLHCGKIKAGVGGGLCQLSNLIYWMTLHAPLTVTERHRHSYDVFPDAGRTQPFGSGATCVYNYRDLQILNDTNYIFQLYVYLTDTHLWGQWRSNKKQYFEYEVYEKNHRIRQEFWGGYTRHNTINRRIYSMDGNLLNDEYVTENHAIMMYQPLLENKVI